MEQRLAKPLGDRVLLSELDSEKETTTAAGIIIPDSAKDGDIKKAKVEAVGGGLFTQSGVLIPMNVKPGDEVIIPPYHQGNEVRIEGKKYILLRESEILMVIN